jgi:hypothetical protein
MGTAEAIFTLRHVIDNAHNERKPVFAAFVDFRQAYDTVDRDLLWRCLEGMGMHGECLQGIQAMYMHVQLRVRVGCERGPAFTSDVGVKQGDPLSPVLFGLFIDRICAFLHDELPETDVCVGSHRLDCLLYADDLVLLAHDRNRLQMLLDKLNVFCKATLMSVNVDKTEVVIFNKHRDIGSVQPLKFGRHPLKMATRFVYLGVVFHSKGSKESSRAAARRRMEKAQAALFGFIGTCHSMRIFDTQTLSYLFDSLSLPCLLYGAEVWAPLLLLSSKQGWSLRMW